VGLGNVLLSEQLFNPWLQRRKSPIELARISSP
jgi:hypothetical protein